MKILAFRKFVPRAYFETALSGAVLAWAHGQMANSSTSFIYAIFVFFGTLTVYNLLRVVSLFRQVQTKLNWRTVPDLFFVPFHIVITILSGIVTLLFLFFQKFDFNGILLIGALFFVTLSYRFRWFRVNGQKTALSDLPYLKSFLVAGVWTLMCSMIPFNLSSVEGLLYLSVFVYFFGLSIPFDIRDYFKDHSSRKTIPQVFGIARAKTISVILVLSSHVSLAYCLKNACIMLAISSLYHTFLITRSAHSSENIILYRMLDLGPLLLGLSICFC